MEQQNIWYGWNGKSSIICLAVKKAARKNPDCRCMTYAQKELSHSQSAVKMLHIVIHLRFVISRVG